MFKKMKFSKQPKSVFFFIIPILMFCMIGCDGDDDNQVETIPLFLEGNYVGTWNSETPSATFIDYGISANLQISGTNTLSGSWFGTSNFEVCCSNGDNDGTITMEISGNEITSFLLDDVIPDCSGVFTGTGVIRESDNALVIDFMGTDCDGLHDGEMVFIKE